jgi:hypothetical protein
MLPNTFIKERAKRKAMKLTVQGRCCQGLFQAMQKRLVLCNQSPGVAGANTNILPPRLIASREGEGS